MAEGVAMKMEGRQEGMEMQGRKTRLSWCLTDLRRSEESTGIAGETGSIPRSEVDGWLLCCSSFHFGLGHPRRSRP